MRIKTEYHRGDNATLSRLWCIGGWNEETTATVRTRNFEQLVLIGNDEIDFLIPPLESLSSVENLHLQCSGNLLGAEIFSGVKTLNIEFVPNNGVDFACFPRLESLIFEWEKGLDAAIQNLTELKEIWIDGGKAKDCTYFSNMTKLTKLKIIQGALAALNGLNSHPHLTTLSLAFLRHLTSVNEVYELKGLRELYFEKLPKVSGVFELARFTSLEIFQSWDTKQTIDLSNLDKLTNLNYINITDGCVNFDIEQLFRLTRLKFISLPARGGLENETTVRRLANANGYKIKRLNFVGTKTKPHLHLSFEA